MKIIVFFIFFITEINYSQHPISGVVEYTIESVTPIDSIRLSTQNDSKIAQNDKEKFIELISKPAYFVLEFNSYESSYKNNEIVMQSDEDKKIKVSALQIFGGGNNCNFYSNIENKITEVQFQPFGEQLIVSCNFPEWEITDETKYIDKYKCYKAYIFFKGKLNKKDEIWFTPEIPFQFGPNKYVGLPGLVLEVNMGKIRFIATKITLDMVKEIKIEKPNKGLRLSEIEFDKKVEKIGTEFGF